MIADPGATRIQPPHEGDDPPLASPDLDTGYEADSNRPDLVDPAGEQILPEELPEVDADPADLTGLHDRAGDEQRYT